MACDHLPFKNFPKKRGKNKKKKDFFQKTRIQTILDKSPRDSTAIFILLHHFSGPSQKSASFSKFSCSSPLPYTKLKIGKKFWIHASNIVCGVKEGVEPV